MTPVVLALAWSAASSTSVAVLADGVPKNDTRAIRAGAAAAGADVVAAATVEAAVGRARRAGLRCAITDVDCAARLGAFGGFDFVLVVAPDPVDPTAVRVTLVECESARALRSWAGPLGADDARATGLQALASAALGGDPPRGTLVVAGNGDGGGNGIVRVDDVERGRAPLSLPVSAGRHVVVVDGQAREVVVPVAARVVVGRANRPAAPGPRDGDGNHDHDHDHADDGRGRLGLVSAAVGGVLAVGGGAGALVVAPDRARREEGTARAYNDAVFVGRALLGVAAAGVVVAGAGLALWAVDAE